MMGLKRLAVALGICLAASPVLAQGSGVVREYWIAADEVLWDYAPSFPINLMSGQPFTPEQRVFVEEQIGRVYLKSIYREYTRGWGSLIERTPQQKQELGILGPILRAEVGDSIKVHFLNNTQFPASVHPHGVFYRKDSEGAPYADGTSGADKADDAVPPGGSHTYEWRVPWRAGPGPNDPSSICWLYHGHAPETASTNAGLIGAMVITARGRANADATPIGVDKECFTLYNVFDENVSSYLDLNLAGCATCDPTSEIFEESNLMHGMNGLLWGNTGYTMRVGQRVRWYVMAMGTEVDLHTPHWHGATLLHNGNRVDVTELLPASTKTLDMRPDVAGKWMYHCHVNDHIEAGMMATYTVLAN